MLVGTGSYVGKSFRHRLCRLFLQDGFHPAPTRHSIFPNFVVTSDGKGDGACTGGAS